MSIDRILQPKKFDAPVDVHASNRFKPDGDKQVVSAGQSVDASPYQYSKGV